MGIISKLVIILGLLVTVTSNLATYYGIRTAVNGMLDSANGGIGIVAWGMDSAYFFSVVSLVGCFILLVGLVLAALAKKR